MANEYHDNEPTSRLYKNPDTAQSKEKLENKKSCIWTVYIEPYHLHRSTGKPALSILRVPIMSLVADEISLVLPFAPCLAKISATWFTSLKMCLTVRLKSFDRHKILSQSSLTSQLRRLCLFHQFTRIYESVSTSTLLRAPHSVLLTDLSRRLGASLVAYTVFFNRFDGFFNNINGKLIALGSSTRSHGLISDGRAGEGNERAECPKWAHLVSLVDHKVDRALAILRPQSIVDHQALLASLGWPPPLSTSISSNLDTRKSTEVPNPHFTMQGDLKYKCCEMAKKVALHQPLWAIEELVNPISLASQRHFSKSINKPEFIFALVYKITRDYVDSMDELLLPLVDEAMQSEYSCGEEWVEWVLAMVISLSTYLAKDCHNSRSQARTSLLHLVDLMISFDKRVRSLVEHSGTLLSFAEDENLQKIYCLFLSDALEKIKPEIYDEKFWRMKVQGGSSKDFKSLAISIAFLKHLSFVVERCRSLPSTSLRQKVSQISRCQEGEGLTALIEDDAMIKVAKSCKWYLDEEIRKLERFIAKWVKKLSVYIKNRRQWQEKGEEAWTMVSKSLFGALDYLQGKISVLEKDLNGIDFVGVWRRLDAGVDRLVFNGILTSNVKFYDGGVVRFDSFFSKVTEGLKLLKMGKKQLQESLVGGEKWMKDNGIRHLSVTETEKIVRSRVFPN
ncbi:hypothetical protein I3843_08G001600 [Carya illinoinensis]|nr:hypothetical protein I3843_08G001600 [Carya illinoinensis]